MGSPPINYTLGLAGEEQGCVSGESCRQSLSCYKHKLSDGAGWTDGHYARSKPLFPGSPRFSTQTSPPSPSYHAGRGRRVCNKSNQQSD